MKEFMNKFGGFKISLPRKIPVSLDQDFEIHVFVDASKLAYAACVYCRSLTDQRTSLIFAKSRIRPVKLLSIPKRELMAALIGSRSLLYIISHLAEEHKIHFRKTYLWSYSRCVFYWLKDETKLLKRFIENRVKEIRKCKAIFRYVPSELNPADIPSRGAMPRALSESTLWWNGPKFLVETEKDWPKNEVPDQSHDEDEFENWEEVNKNCKLIAANIKSFNFQTIQLYDPKYFDSWKTLNRSIALMS